MITCLVALLVLTATISIVGRLRVAAVTQVLTTQILPAQRAVAQLVTAYVDQETGQRGYLLTGDPQFLEPYQTGLENAERLQRRLGTLLAGRGDVQPLLAKVRLAASTWQADSATPEIGLRRVGPLPPAELETFAVNGKKQFDYLRAQLTNLREWAQQATASQLAAIATAQHLANIITIGASALALLSALASIPLMARLVNRPMEQLVSQVGLVAQGDHNQPITPSGASELLLIGRSVEHMRTNMVHSAQLILDAESELTLQREHDRLAAELRDLTIQRIFGLSLSLSALAQRHPRIHAEVLPLIHEADRTIRELLSVIFNISHAEKDDKIRADIVQLIEESSETLGFTPTVELVGSIQTSTSDTVRAELLAVARTTMVSIAEHTNASAATVSVEVTEKTITLTIGCDGTGTGSEAVLAHRLTSVAERAQQLGGDLTVTSTEAGETTLTWQVPQAHPDSGMNG
jgi:CHASE3 domain sensor protein